MWWLDKVHSGYSVEAALLIKRRENRQQVSGVSPRVLPNLVRWIANCQAKACLLSLVMAQPRIASPIW